MILDITLAEAIEAVGHGGGTKTRELRDVLRKFGMTCPDRLLRMSRNYNADLAIIKIVPHNQPYTGWHWAVYNMGTWHDPVCVAPKCRVNGSLTGYLPIE